VAVSKIDVPEVQASLPTMKQRLAKVEVPVFYISAVSGQAMLQLARKAMEMVEQASREEEMIPQAEIAVFRPKPRKV